MSPLKSVTLINFRSHAALTVDLAPLTFIVADNNVGKTNVLRAIRWCALNEGSYAEVVKHGETLVVVHCDFDDGTRVTRRASKTDNGYTLTQPDGAVIEFNKVGNSVPVEVQRVFRVSGLQQWNPHFQGVDDPAPTHLSPTVLASIFGETVGVSWVEERQKEIAKGERATRIALTEAQRALDGAEATLAAFPPQDEVERLVASIQLGEKRLAALTDTLYKAQALVTRTERIARAMKIAPNLSQAAEVLSKIVAGRVLLDELTAKALTTASLIGRWDAAVSRAGRGQQAVVDIEAQLASLSLCPTCGQPWDGRHDHDSTG